MKRKGSLFFKVLIAALVMGGHAAGGAALDTGWRLACDAQNLGVGARWFDAVRPEAGPAPVPGIVQQVFPGYHGVAWYWLEFTPGRAPLAHERALVRFGAVDYLADVWLNGRPVGRHEGGETPFTLDVTDALRPAATNLLAVRVLNPTDEPVDGIRRIETPHSQNGNPSVGAAFNPSGIVLPVELAIEPAVRLVDVFASPDIHSGRVKVLLTVRNDTAAALRGSLDLSIAPDQAGATAADASLSGDFAPGETRHEVSVTVPGPRWWTLDDPWLYRASATLTADLGTAAIRHLQSVRFGFRDFRVRDGFFFLNDRRIYLRSCHTAAWFPVTQTAPDVDLMRRDLLLAKASGFNCVRFLSKLPLPAQLDFADELGILVYAEPYGAWWSVKDEQVTDRGKVVQRYTDGLREAILRDRNHPSLAVWGLLNEVADTVIFKTAAASLPLIRSLDDTRLVLLGSGRWDKQYATGSICNPGSLAWECQWGREGTDYQSVLPTNAALEHEVSGDVHYYPATPVDRKACGFLRTLGADAGPVFLSEGGIGSLMNAVGDLRQYESRGVARQDLEERVFLKNIADRLTDDWARLRMETAYPTVEGMLRDSQRVHLSQRRLWFDLVRANPNLCGHSLTSMLDGFTSGEGFWNMWREPKPGMVDVLRDGWAPLRWSLFVDPLHGYAGRPMHVEAVLANEDVLKPGAYPVTFRISGPQGVVWEKRITLDLPAAGKRGLPPLAVPALDETVTLAVPAGEYTFAADLERGGAAAGSRRAFRISAVGDLPRLKGTVTVWGVAPHICEWLRRHGIRTREFHAGQAPAREVLLVGTPRAFTFDQWGDLLRRIGGGAYAVFIDPELYRWAEWLPLAKKGHCARNHDWLYHKEAVARAHPVFDGLPAPGILDWDDYDDVAGHYMMLDADDPDETIVAGFASGLTQLDKDYTFASSGVMVGEYRLGAGHWMLSTLGIVSNVDRHPAADRLLLNMVRHAQRNAQTVAGRDEGFEARMHALYPFLAEVAPEPDGSFVLLPRRAELQNSGDGPALAVNPDGTDRIGKWGAPGGQAVWRVKVDRPGRYRVLLEQACPPEGAGSTYSLRAGDTVLDGTVQPSRAWFDYVSVDAGSVDLPRGSFRLSLAPVALKKEYHFMDVRRIRLIPQEGSL